MRTPRLPVVVLFLLLGLALSACSHGRAKDISQALADRLTDAMSIDGATKEEGTAPSPDLTPGRPLISDVQLPETLYADAPLTITLTSATVESGKIVGVVLLVPKASHYMAISTEIGVEAGQSVIRLKGHMNEADLNGEFSFMFALKGTDGRVGAYTEKRFRIGREAKACSDEPCCNGGVWQAEGQLCRQGDTYPCTVDRCQADHSCLSTLYSESCQIEGKCYDAMERKPDNNCQKCYPGNVQNDWTTFEDGASCDAGSGADSGQCKNGVCLPVSVDGDPEGDSGEAESDSDAEVEADPDTDPDVQLDGDGETGENDADSTDNEADSEEALPLTWVTIPEGNYMMGCLSVDMNCATNENLHHSVTLKSFEMLKTEVTQGQFSGLLRRNPSQFTTCGVNCPVESVSWDDANEFCTTLGARLPTEAEWEYAARAGGISIYPCGADSTCLPSIAWCEGNSQQTPHPVARLLPNAWNLYDMAGNVSEWVEDTISANYDNTPTDGSAWVELGVTKRVVRGGSWKEKADDTIHRSSYRGSYERVPSQPVNTLGFRCARDLLVDGDVDAEAEEEVDSYPSSYCSSNSCFLAPPTNQTECYGDTSAMTCPAEGLDYYGQDAQYATKHQTRSFVCHDATGSTIPCSMVASAGETVEDSVTGLVWQREIPSVYSGCAAGATCTLSEAIVYCDNLALGPFSDYHLPTIHELVSLASYEKNAPTYDSLAILTRESGATYWSVSPLPGNPGGGLAFYSQNGTTATLGSPEFSPQTVRCVRSAQAFTPPTYPRFVRTAVNSEAYYTDRVTNLIWKDGSTVALSWRNALTLCESATFAGRTDWRVPNVHELMSLVDFSQAAAPYGEIPAAPKAAVWTSTTPASSTSEAYIVDFNWASLSKLMKSDSATTVWCVSGPEQAVSGR